MSLPTRRRRPGRRKSFAVKTKTEVLAGKDEVGRRVEDEGRPPDVVAGECLEGRLPEVLAGEEAEEPPGRRKSSLARTLVGRRGASPSRRRPAAGASHTTASWAATCP